MRGNCCLIAVLPLLLSRSGQSLAPRGLSSLAAPSSLSLLSWNINGFRSLLKHDASLGIMRGLIESKQPDFICLQETKLQEMHTESIEAQLRDLGLCEHMKVWWNSSRARKGYSGTCVIALGGRFNADEFSITYGIGEEQGDLEGRAITIEHDKFSLTNVYVPNSGDGLKRLDYRTRQWDRRLSEFMMEQRDKTPERIAILTGDLNVAHQSIDYYNPEEKRTRKQAGTTPEEQESFQTQLIDTGFVDSYRHMYPDNQLFSYFSARRGQAGYGSREGLRIDYVMVGKKSWEAENNSVESLRPDAASATSAVQDAFILDDIWSPYSDHCPVGAIIPLEE